MLSSLIENNCLRKLRKLTLKIFGMLTLISVVTLLNWSFVPYYEYVLSRKPINKIEHSLEALFKLRFLQNIESLWRYYFEIPHSYLLLMSIPSNLLWQFLHILPQILRLFGLIQIGLVQKYRDICFPHVQMLHEKLALIKNFEIVNF